MPDPEVKIPERSASLFKIVLTPGGQLKEKGRLLLDGESRQKEKISGEGSPSNRGSR